MIGHSGSSIQTDNDATMKRCFLVFLTCSLSLVIHAQLIDTHSSLTVSFMNGSFRGDNILKEGGFAAPSFFTNFKELSGLSVSFLRKVTPFLSAGVDAGSSKAASWDYSGSNLFTGSEASVHSSSLVFQLHNPFSRTGIANRLKIFAEMAPSIGFLNYELGKSGMSFHYKQNLYKVPLRNQQTFAGYRLGGGVDFAFNQNWGILVAYTWQKSMIYGPTFMDDAYTSSGMTFGLSYRFHKDKRFYKYW
jgi:opacity protein-like surface antigen